MADSPRAAVLGYERAMPDGLSSWFPLRRGRVHEAGGPAASAFAAICAGSAGATTLWVREAWRSDVLSPVGLSQFADPSAFLFAQAANQAEILAVMEEALRDGAAALVVAELGKAVGLKAGRRLQLAAERGGAAGLCLTPEGAGCPAAETRWTCTPVFDPEDSTLQLWRLIKNKSGILGNWHVRWDSAARRLDVVSPAGERPGSEGAPG